MKKIFKLTLSLLLTFALFLLPATHGAPKRNISEVVHKALTGQSAANGEATMQGLETVEYGTQDTVAESDPSQTPSNDGEPTEGAEVDTLDEGTGEWSAQSKNESVDYGYTQTEGTVNSGETYSQEYNGQTEPSYSGNNAGQNSSEGYSTNSTQKAVESNDPAGGSAAQGAGQAGGQTAQNNGVSEPVLWRTEGDTVPNEENATGGGSEAGGLNGDKALTDTNGSAGTTRQDSTGGSVSNGNGQAGQSQSAQSNTPSYSYNGSQGASGGTNQDSYSDGRVVSPAVTGNPNEANPSEYDHTGTENGVTDSTTPTGESGNGLSQAKSYPQGVEVEKGIQGLNEDQSQSVNGIEQDTGSDGDALTDQGGYLEPTEQGGNYSQSTDTGQDASSDGQYTTDQDGNRNPTGQSGDSSQTTGEGNQGSNSSGQYSTDQNGYREPAETNDGLTQGTEDGAGSNSQATTDQNPTGQSEDDSQVTGEGNQGSNSNSQYTTDQNGYAEPVETNDAATPDTDVEDTDPGSQATTDQSGSKSQTTDNGEAAPNPAMQDTLNQNGSTNPTAEGQTGDAGQGQGNTQIENGQSEDSTQDEVNPVTRTYDGSGYGLTTQEDDASESYESQSYPQTQSVQGVGKSSGSSAQTNTKSDEEETDEEQSASSSGLTLRNSTVNSPSDIVVPTPFNHIAPQSIELTSDVSAVAPGDSFSVTARLKPMQTDSNIIDNAVWSATLGQLNLIPEGATGPEINLTVPEDATEGTISVSVTLPAAASGAAEDLRAVKEFNVNSNRLAIAIFASTNSPTVVKNTDLGFSSELLQGNKSASDQSLLDGAKYIWTSKLGREYLKGKSFGSTYSVYPRQAGQLSVELSVKLKDGTILKADPIIKGVSDSKHNLAGVSISPADGNVTDTVMVGTPVTVAAELSPADTTNLDEAGFEWSVTLNGNPVPTDSEEMDSVTFTPGETGDLEVSLVVTPKDAQPVSSNTLSFAATLSGEGGNDLKIISADISADRNTTTLHAGDEVVLNADVTTEGEEGKVNYKWTATDDRGQVIATGDQPEGFRLTPTDASMVTVEFMASVSNDLEATNAEVDTADPEKTNLPELETQEQEANSMAQSNGEEAVTQASGSGEEDQEKAKNDFKTVRVEKVFTFLPKQAGLTTNTANSNANGSGGENNNTSSPAATSEPTAEPVKSTNPSNTTQEYNLGVANANSYKAAAGKTGQGKALAQASVASPVRAAVPNAKEATSVATVENTQSNTHSDVKPVASGTKGSANPQTLQTLETQINTNATESSGRYPTYRKNPKDNSTTIDLFPTTLDSGRAVSEVFSRPARILNPITGQYLTVGELAVIVTVTALVTLGSVVAVQNWLRRNKTPFF